MPPGPTLLFDAIERYYRLLATDDPEGREAFSALDDWFESRDLVGPDSFERLCARYRIDPDTIRRMLRRRRGAASRA